jgi:antitoxin HicB
MDYPLILTPDDNDTFLVTSPDFPELTSFGETEEEAAGYGLSALLEAIAARIAHKDDIPDASHIPGAVRVQMPSLVAYKVLLYRQMRAKGVNKAKLARDMGCHLPQIDRLLDLNHASRLDVLDNAFRALGKDVELTLKDRAA